MNAMMRLEDPSDFIIIQIGRNDIGNGRIAYSQLQLNQFIPWVSKELPHASIVFEWRSEWRYSEDIETMEKCRRRLNSTVAAFLMN